MDIENTGSYIISGSAPAAKPLPVSETERAEKPAEAVKAAKVTEKKEKHFHSGRKFRLPSFRELKSVAKGHSRKFMAACAGAMAFGVGLTALSSYCTVGVDYFYGDQLLCTVAAADNSAAIIGEAAQRADLLGVDEPEIQVSAKLALRKDLVDGEEAIDAILAASPELCRGYIVSVDGIDLFVASDRETISSALDEYTKKYAMNDKAALSAEIDIRNQIVHKDEVTPVSNIIPLLEQGGVLSVISTVDEILQEPIPFETSEVEDSEMYAGDTEVETPGVEGQAKTTVESIFCNGELLSASVIHSETLVEPVTEVIRVGTKPRNALEDGLSYPLSGQFTSGFGPRWGRQHQGIDLAVSVGTNVAAAASGKVIVAKYNDGYGNYVQIDHGYGVVTTYAHLSSISVKTGQAVNRGQIIGRSGNTGNSTGPHLHFEVIKNGTHLNPLNYLKK